MRTPTPRNGPSPGPSWRSASASGSTSWRKESKTGGQMERLVALGCRFGQGYHFARPGALGAPRLAHGTGPPADPAPVGWRPDGAQG